jgi:ketosteroid isomerase-like protein
MNSSIQRQLLSSLACCGLSAFMLFPIACKREPLPDTHAADEQVLRDLNVQWAKTAEAKDLNGVVAFYTEDAFMLPPNRKAAEDKQAIRDFWSSLLGAEDSIFWEASKVDIARSGDLAYVAGFYRLTLNDPQGNPVADDGKFLQVWKKEPDGKWKVVTDCFNSDLPLPARSEEKK